MAGLPVAMTDATWEAIVELPDVPRLEVLELLFAIVDGDPWIEQMPKNHWGRHTVLLTGDHFIELERRSDPEHMYVFPPIRYENPDP